MDISLAAILTLVKHLFIWCHLVLLIAFFVRVIMQRLPVGVTLAWLLVLALLPYVGVGLYLLFGERFLGINHNRRRRRLNKAYRNQTHADGAAVTRWPHCHPASAAIARLEATTAGIPALAGNAVTFYQTAQETIAAICADIQNAQQTCHLEFYIWQPGGITSQVEEALLKAQSRGVECRVMLDAVGSAAFFNSAVHHRLSEAGMTIVRANPIRLMPWKLARYDLRNHRKTVVIDNRLAFMGSFNLIDPSQFKQQSSVGEWIDLMARIEGPVAPLFDAVFRWYWNIETGHNIPLLENTKVPTCGEAILQINPSGPDSSRDSILETLLQGIYAAKKSVDIVTPYFVPGEALELALKIAARRGVQVRVVVPQKVDSFLVRHASRSSFEQLMKCGVEIYEYSAGLLHTKALVIDEQLAFFGTVNLDVRSLWLNFEMTMTIYDPPTTEKLVAIIHQYHLEAEPLALKKWQQRGIGSRFLENIVHLFSPLI